MNGYNSGSFIIKIYTDEKISDALYSCVCMLS